MTTGTGSGAERDGRPDDVGDHGGDGGDGRGGRGGRGDGERDTDAGYLRERDPRDGLTRAERRGLRLAWWSGAVPVLALYAWVLMAGRWAPLQRQYFDDFFDIQARAFLNGRLEVPDGSVGFEGFLIDGKTYLYFGPVPSLIRLPVLAVTDRFDGRLTTLSMLAATVLLAAAAFRLACVVRTMVRGDEPVGRRERRAWAGLAVAVLAAPPFFLASGAIVYHEATIWGVALSVAALDAVARWQRAPSGWRLVGATALITGAVLSRQTLGLGPLCALGLAGLTLALARWRGGATNAERPGGAAPDDDRAGDRRRVLTRLLPALALAGFVPLFLSSYLNYAKLDQWFGLPMDRQIQSLWTGGREEVLAAHPGFMGTEYVTTTALQYLRPDAVDLRSDFPYLDFPRTGPTLVDEDAAFDALDWSSSIPASAPALTAVTLAAVVWTVRTRRRRAFADRLSPLLVGSLAGGVSVLLFAYVANRYLNDLYPFVLVGGLVGFMAAGQAARARWRPALRGPLVGAAGMLVLAGLLVNLVLALEYQRERGPVVPEAWRAEWARWRVDMPGAREPLRVALDERLPPVADGGLAVVGDCGGLYVGVRDRWLGVERGPDVGVYEVRLDVDALPVGDRVPLLTFRDDEHTTVLGAVRLDDGDVRVDVLPPEWTEPEWVLGSPVPLDGTVTLRASTDPRQLTASIQHGSTVLNPAQLGAPGRWDEVLVGEAPDREGVRAAFPGVEPVPFEPGLCEDAVG